MFCEKCGAKVNENDKFCQNCGAVIYRDDEKTEFANTAMRQNDKNKKKVNKRQVFIAAVAVVVVVFVITVFSAGSDKQTLLVKEGNLEYYPEVTIGEAFKNWFSSPQWNYDSKTRLVKFTGKCAFGDKPVKVTIDFRLYDNGVFETDLISMDDTYSVVYLSEQEWLYLYASIFEDAYREKGLEPPANLGAITDFWDYIFN